MFFFFKKLIQIWGARGMKWSKKVKLNLTSVCYCFLFCYIERAFRIAITKEKPFTFLNFSFPFQMWKLKIIQAPKKMKQLYCLVKLPILYFKKESRRYSVKSCSYIFCKIHRKRFVPETLFNKVESLRQYIFFRSSTNACFCNFHDWNTSQNFKPRNCIMFT